MRTITLAIHFSRDLEPKRIIDAHEVFRSEIEKLLCSTGMGPGGAWGYGTAYVENVTTSVAQSGAHELLRKLHCSLRPDLHRDEHTDDPSPDRSLDTLRVIACSIERALLADPVSTQPARDRSRGQ